MNDRKADVLPHQESPSPMRRWVKTSLIVIGVLALPFIVVFLLAGGREDKSGGGRTAAGRGGGLG